MKSIKSVALTLAIVVMVATLFSGAPEKAAASSSYDAAVRVVDELQLISPDGTKSQDITYNWRQFISPDYSTDTSCGSDEVEDLGDAFAQGYLAVTLHDETHPGNNQQRLQVFWSSLTGAGGFTAGYFDVAGGVAFTYAPPVTGGALVSIGNNGVIASTCVDYTGSYASPISAIFSTSGTLSGTNTFVFGSTYPISYPAGYEGSAVPAGAPPAKYVAMGDSFSSGEGVPGYEQGSDTMANVCHRSSSAFPRLLQSNLDMGPTAFVACSGSVIEYIADSFNAENMELPQISMITDYTETVTITIGGNDVGFGDTIATCVASDVAQDCLDAVELASEKSTDSDLVTSLQAVFSEVKSLSGDDTQIYVVGYPNLFPAYEEISGACTWGDYALSLLSSDVSARSITEDEIDALREVHDELNSALDSAVDATANEDIHFIDPTSVFEDHEICGSSDDWLHGVFLHPSTTEISVGSYHPNSAGQEAYADLLESVIGG